MCSRNVSTKNSHSIQIFFDFTATVLKKCLGTMHSVSNLLFRHHRQPIKDEYSRSPMITINRIEIL